MREQKCLLLKNALHGRYELPGGRMEVGDSDTKIAMAREITEETGITQFAIIDRVGWEAWTIS
ncbi:MAG: NUDIX domain-containing protein [Candidatus Magasanikbacteria bacterium]|uniref:Nudix hydrolase domain-containing protein n=1 Tax=Candidatus Magasanikbacteria bacterium CG10_big_fil_rev_8_21_14_0_10_38_6 TaxID=1974647 RepID=A0A2M6NZQ4_9BACT|nr:NUDIX domain-containing protein [Candidatus Magasanikbacteria bacterium]PIR76921.1 MAG: hypothetical protein COU30_05290 [Candidatus Magasanikbacteria bacterium CG10_big_fil_rev_8_21_14_0_10_38_6]